MSELRSPNTVKTVETLAIGSTAVWTPPAGKRWRLMGGVLTIPADRASAAGGDLKIRLLDVAAEIGLNFRIHKPVAATPAIGDTVIPFNLWPGSILAAAAATALNVDLNTALTVSLVSAVVWGVEE